jgi:hypothetical protein
MADHLNTTIMPGIEDLDNPTDKIAFAFPTWRARKCRGWRDDLPDFAPEFHERFPFNPFRPGGALSALLPAPFVHFPSGLDTSKPPARVIDMGTGAIGILWSTASLASLFV